MGKNQVVEMLNRVVLERAQRERRVLISVSPSVVV